MDWTQITLLLISLVVSVCVSLITRQLVPWLKDKKLYDAAIVAVDAAEALYGRYHGEEKLQYAIEILKDKGYNVDTAAVMDALRSAWKNLDSAMRLTGEKENKPVDP